jgi:DNA-binding CsgD family transcriptional regulator
MDDVPAAALPLARMRLSMGESAAAIALLDPALPAGALTLTDVASVGVAIEAHLAAGSIARAGELAERLTALAAQAGSPVLRAEAGLLAGKVTAQTDAPRAAVILAEALAICPYPDSPQFARIRLEQAKVAASLDPPDVAGAVMHARAALAGFRRLDAHREVDESLQLLRALGSPTRLQQPSGRGAASLTRREAEVLTLVGAGLSNPEIAGRLYLSPKTVEHHVGHVFTKLGLTSRSALAAYAARKGPKIGEFPDVPLPTSGADSPHRAG